MSNTVERHLLDNGEREITLTRKYDLAVEVLLRDRNGEADGVLLHPDEAVLLRNFLNREFPDAVQD